MKPKTARRWLKRNAWDIALHNARARSLSRSQERRFKECQRTLLTEKEEDTNGETDHEHQS